MVRTSKTEKGVCWEVQANNQTFHKSLRRRSILCVRWGRYADNVVRSYKYTPLTFLPLNLYEQFQRAANLFFLLIVILQCVPIIATIPWYSTMLPLLFVLVVRGCKDLATDVGRRRSDSQINKRPCDVLTPEGFRTVKWKDVCAGDILRVHKDQVIPADLLLLCSTEPHSLCYVETADIDGETNLKFRQALTVTHAELKADQAEKDLAAFNGVVWCEEPNGNLHSFKGELHWKGERHLLDIDNLLLRGTVMRNTNTAYGLAIYTGMTSSDSKILQNCGRLILKKTRVEVLLNKTVLVILLFMLTVALLLAIGAGIFELQVAPQLNVLVALQRGSSAAYLGFLNFWGYIILLSPSMPMSLYITFEVIHVVHCLLIGWDLEMYWEDNDSPAQARTSTLNEELGQVGHLLSDKTGTLTQNRLLFRQCYIDGKIYGDMSQECKPLDLSWNRFSCGGMKFSDQRLVEKLRGWSSPECQEFFTALALCHTVMSEWKDGLPQYQAASPDEDALVCAARELGWVFLSRTRETLTISELGITRNYQLLAILDFTSKRRRMSVLVREPGGELKLYCKGADIVILERLQKDQPLQEDTDSALELFAQNCLRTLCVAVRPVPESLWTEWSHALNQASMAGGNQETMLEEIYDQMERELMLLGMTAIEDRLQEGVPETIEILRKAGVKVWVLTGDKTETAVNVGYACKLMDPDTALIQGEELRQLLDSPSPDVRAMSKEPEVWITDRKSVKSKTALVIAGPELEELTQKPEWGARFVNLAGQCQSVLCCRVTPAQKAEIVEMVKKHSTSITMAIGDGANDVNMIKTAHIGVGVCGVEGSQAVQNADFALAQFSFLRRLLLVHGHWSYYRVCGFLLYFLYKTSAFALVHVWYSFYNGYSAQPMYESWFISLYSTTYTSLPVQCLGIFEQDVSAKSCFSWPEIYSVGQENKLFNPLVVALTLLYSLYSSIILFFIPMGILQHSTLDFQTLAITVETSVVFTSTVEVVLKTKYWTKYSFAAIVFSLVAFFLSTFVLHSTRLFTASPKDYFFLGASANAFSSPEVWLTIFVTTCVAVLPSMTMRALSVVLTNPNKHKIHSSKEPVILQSWFQRGTLRRRSSYAVSQGKGFGKLITTGVGLHSAAPPQDRRVTPNGLIRGSPQHAGIEMNGSYRA
ncbi:putative phospholipid-transporting ATPase IC [Triplophysa rosa]|uniref:Phospholipid-transporting ATPase n=1 Tax=Triplophysa rosa TaxID=992332 RepID=A0A9W7W9Q0_TRIRA|nr:putative phospholipid-transporting ATPase IC [Triplophysa rosa]